MSEPIWRVELPDEAATRALAQELATMVGAGDLVTLSGDLGAGKTTFARALIRAVLNDPELEAPSPSFTLLQLYDGPDFPILHADFYRLHDGSELAELGWDEAAEGALALVEWAERAGSALGEDRLDVTLKMESRRGPDFRLAEIIGHGGAAKRLIRLRGAQNLLERCGWDEAERIHMQGDASTRAYELLARADGDRAVLMISPPRPDGPPVKGGKPYSAIARLAENIKPFVAIDEALIAQNLSAPRIFAADLNSGFAVLEFLGSEGVADEHGPRPDRYAEAAKLLASLHARDLPQDLLYSGGAYRIPPYDLDAFLIEVELLVDWFAPHIMGVTLASGARAQYENIWRNTLAGPLAEKKTWVLRDYHSPNLLWLPNRGDIQRLGLIDFQDCVMGPCAYDLVSLAQDARVTVSDDLEIKLLSAYALTRQKLEPGFDLSAFARSYAIMGAQRASKILGIFARLDKRDGKPAYLAHLPRVKSYLKKDLGHPALAELKNWFALYLPKLFVEEPR